jgi:hypothetical protein
MQVQFLPGRARAATTWQWDGQQVRRCVLQAQLAEKDATLIKVLKSNLFTLKRSLVTLNSSLMSGIKMPCFAE